MTNIEIFMSHLLAERNAAMAKFPTNKFQLPALMEEVGELAQALMECQVGDADRFGTMARNSAIINIYEESVQVASMAMRLALEGDEQFPAYIPTVGQGVSAWQYPQYGDEMSVVSRETGNG